MCQWYLTTQSFREVQLACKDKNISQKDIESTGVCVMQYSSVGSVAQIIVKGEESEILKRLLWISHMNSAQ